MATATIENAKVEWLIPNYGFKASETKIINGEERKFFYTVWTKEAVKEGDIVTVEGDLSAKIEEFTGRDNQPGKTAAIHLNNALVMKADAPF
jgi:hypothetical protein